MELLFSYLIFLLWRSTFPSAFIPTALLRRFSLKTRIYEKAMEGKQTKKNFLFKYALWYLFHYFMENLRSDVTEDYKYRKLNRTI